MTLDEAKHILSMIRHEQRYRRMVNARLSALQDISRQINMLASPQSQKIDAVGVHSQNPVAIDTKLNELISDEEDAAKAYRKACMLHGDSIRYRSDVLTKVVDEEDKLFVSRYLSKDVSDIDLQDSGYSDPYDHMLRIIRNLDIVI